ncbi:hypothetical protein C0J52_09488 [Blattella germanica]|nr:hypothetical protein C0J52_09488 [Blattella germanica]
MGNKSGKPGQTAPYLDSILSEEEFASLSKFHRKSQRRSSSVGTSSHVKDNLKYVISIVSSYLKMIIHLKDNALVHWKKLEFPNSQTAHKRYAQFLCQGLQSSKNVEADFEKWYSECPQFQKLQTIYVYKLFCVPPPPVTYKHQMIEKHLVPSLFQSEGLQKGTSFSILDMTDVLFLNSVLPKESQFEWSLCFSSVLHGQGFGKLVRCVTNKGPTLVIIKDKGGHVFGGYASGSWTIGPNFHGDSESFLFRLYPDMQIFETTGYNNHYQYLNQQQQTMPNGLGMGGQFEYFGFWLDAEYGKGHCSESCSTYRNYKMLSSNKVFEEGGKSILDKDSGAQALLEIAVWLSELHSIKQCTPWYWCTVDIPYV